MILRPVSVWEIISLSSCAMKRATWGRPKPISPPGFPLLPPAAAVAGERPQSFYLSTICYDRRDPERRLNPEDNAMSETPRPLLRELIDIPERVYQGDFVLRLADGVSDAQAAETVRNYVVTLQLDRAFDQALGFIQRAVESRQSGACYLHGSFGAGKSHFMAVLDLLLAGNTQARSIPELAATVTRHDDWMNGKRFLMVPFHMIGARDVESAILGGYAEHVRRLHPEAPTPGFYLGESLFEDARNLRLSIGDHAFFERLNDGTASDDWNAPWDAPGFEAATFEPPEGEERQRLVGDLIARFFGSYRDVAAARGEAFVSLDTGLAIQPMTEAVHADVDC
jgi:hypothetical protein